MYRVWITHTHTHTNNWVHTCTLLFPQNNVAFASLAKSQHERDSGWKTTVPFVVHTCNQSLHVLLRTVVVFGYQAPMPVREAACAVIGYTASVKLPSQRGFSLRPWGPRDPTRPALFSLISNFPRGQRLSRAKSMGLIWEAIKWIYGPPRSLLLLNHVISMSYLGDQRAALAWGMPTSSYTWMPWVSLQRSVA